VGCLGPVIVVAVGPRAAAWERWGGWLCRRVPPSLLAASPSLHRCGVRFSISCAAEHVAVAPRCKGGALTSPHPRRLLPHAQLGHPVVPSVVPTADSAPTHGALSGASAELPPTAAPSRGLSRPKPDPPSRDRISSRRWKYVEKLWKSL